MSVPEDIKGQIIKLLKESRDYISGAMISAQLGVSRTAIWKQINSLKGNGYEIEASTKKGYRLIQAPDALFPWEVSSMLKTQYLGRVMEHHQIIGSTNDRVKELALRAWPEGGMVVAEAQSKGKGRLGRVWLSHPGENLLFSILLRPSISPAQAGNITLLAAVAVCMTIKDLYSLETKIKWPNDVQINGEKVCGILVEMGSDLDRVGYVVVGIGVNVNQDIKRLHDRLIQPACSLAEVLGRKIDRTELLAGILEHLEYWYEKIKQEGFYDLIAATRELSNTIGRWVDITTPQGSFYAKALDISLDGSLIVLTSEQERKQLYSGEISLRKDS
jgi:BirA family biotin operon repressor/biotin-[acetyl-CoA-carboxylase] ligase